MSSSQLEETKVIQTEKTAKDFILFSNFPCVYPSLTERTESSVKLV